MRRHAKRKAKRTAKSARAKARSPRPRSAKASGDTVGALIAASAPALGLRLDPAWQAAIKFNLQLILSHAAVVEEFALPEDIEPAAVFHA